MHLWIFHLLIITYNSSYNSTHLHLLLRSWLAWFKIQVDSSLYCIIQLPCQILFWYLILIDISWFASNLMFENIVFNVTLLLLFLLILWSPVYSCITQIILLIVLVTFILQGQYKSTLVCPACNKVSITFDPFMYLSLPLQSATTRSMTVTVFTCDGSALPAAYTVTVPKQGRCRDLIQALSNACSLQLNEKLLLAEVSKVNCLVVS